MMRILLASLAMIAAATAAAQGLYRWTDANGKLVYGTHPPANVNATAVRERINSYAGPAEVQRAPVAAQPASAQRPQAAASAVVMYATSWCGYCAQARAYFARRGIAYVEHDVEKSAAAHAEFKRLGGKGVPLILYGGQTMRGFSEQGFEALVVRSQR